MKSGVTTSVKAAFRVSAIPFLSHAAPPEPACRIISGEGRNAGCSIRVPASPGGGGE